MSDIRLKNALSQMKNTSTARQPIRRHRSEQGEAWSVECKLAEGSDGHRLQNYMKGELELYNQLVEHFNPTARTAPETFSAFTEKHINLLGMLSEYGGNVRKLKKGHIPNEFKQFESILFDGSITERMKILMEAVVGSFPLTKSTKRSMAREVLKFYVDQARIRSQRAPKSFDQEFKTTPKSLTVQTPISKRHLQLRRDEVKFTFIEDRDMTQVKIPYLSNPILVSGVDLTEKQSWSLMIVHQIPNQMVLSHSPWVLDFRGIKSDYLVDYLDNRNDRSGVFWQAKTNRSGR